MLTLADIIWLLTGFTCQDFNSKYIHCLALQTRIWLGHDIKNYLRRFVQENSFNAKKVTFSFLWKIIWDKKKEIENSWVIKIWAHSIVLSKASLWYYSWLWGEEFFQNKTSDSNIWCQRIFWLTIFTFLQFVLLLHHSQALTLGLTLVLIFSGLDAV